MSSVLQPTQGLYVSNMHPDQTWEANLLNEIVQWALLINWPIGQVPDAALESGLVYQEDATWWDRTHNRVATLNPQETRFLATQLRQVNCQRNPWRRCPVCYANAGLHNPNGTHMELAESEGHVLDLILFLENSWGITFQPV